MVVIYINTIIGGTHGTHGATHGAYSTTTLFRIYDADEVPDNLKERVQKWADTLQESFDIEDYSGKGIVKTYIRPEKGR